MTDVWAEMQRAVPQSVTVGGVHVSRGSRVRLHPGARGDVLDQAMAGRVGIVEGVDESLDGVVHITVTLEDDPGRDMGEGRFPGHRFYFLLDEVEPLDPAGPVPHKRMRILVAGIGNIFLGDDGFGVMVAQRLAERPRPTGVDVVDFGIRGMDLAYAMQADYDVVVLMDAAPRGGEPGTLYVIDATPDADGPVTMDTHGMDPVKVLALARALGRVPPRALVVGCEPSHMIGGEDGQVEWDEMNMELSAPVSAAIDEAIRVVEKLVDELLAERAGLIA